MKNQSKNCKKCCNNGANIDTTNKTISRKPFKLSRWEIIYNRKQKKFKLFRKEVGPDHYVFYSVLNTDVTMSLGVAASLVARSILTLHNTLAANQVINPHIVQWQRSGETIIVLRGYNHKHLKYLEGEVKFTALGKHAIHHRWNHTYIMLALSVFGRKGDIEDTFDGLRHL